MICWHQLLLLNRQQIKHIGAFEHLRSWRELVGTKNKTWKEADKVGTQKAYKVKKERRLRSFIEAISNKVKARVKKLAEEKGIRVGRKQAGGKRDSEEEEEYAKLCEEARKREVKKRGKDKKEKERDHRKKDKKRK
jgi:hypothetical protein